MAVVTVKGDPNRTGGFQVKQPGTYDLTIDSAEMGHSKNKGTPQIELKGRVLGSSHGQHVGDKVTWWISLHENMLGVARGFLDAAGVAWSMQETPDGPGMAFDPDHLVGATVRGELTHGEWPVGSGKKKEEWNNWQPSAYGNARGQQAAPPAQQAAPQGQPQGQIPQSYPGATPPPQQPPVGGVPQGYQPQQPQGPVAGQGQAPVPGQPFPGQGQG